MKLSLEKIYSLIYVGTSAGIVFGGALAELAAQKDMESVLAYKVGRALKRLRAEAKEVEEARMGLIKKYGEDGQGGRVEIKGDALTKFNDEWKALLAEEAEVEVRPLALAEFQKGRAKLSPEAVCELLDVLIQDEGELGGETKP